MPPASVTPFSGQRGFSYVEILLSVVLLAILLVPALDAVQTAVMGSQNGATVLARELALRDYMERVLARPFAELYERTYAQGGNSPGVNAALSEPEGTADRRNVVLYRFDASTPAVNGPDKGRTQADSGLIYILVYYERDGRERGLSTLVGRWW